MGEIPFTQYLRPNGRKSEVTIDRPEPICTLAQQIRARGYRFECESLVTGHASLTISDDKADHAIAVVPNGPEVPVAIDKMVLEFSCRLGLRGALP